MDLPSPCIRHLHTAGLWQEPGVLGRPFLPTLDPVGTFACWAALENSELSSSFFGDRMTVLGKDMVENMLFIMSSEAEEKKGQAPVCKAEALAPISFGGQLPPSHMLLSQEFDTARLRTWE